MDLVLPAVSGMISPGQRNALPVSHVCAQFLHQSGVVKICIKPKDRSWKSQKVDLRKVLREKDKLKSPEVFRMG
jgi:hypothetical protein